MSTQNVNAASTHPLFDAVNANRTQKTTASDDMQNNFLNLLITQLKNQDPLNPTDANQMTAQLSQISTVSGIEKLNATMDKLLGSYNSAQNMQAAAMIGKTVFIAGNEMDNQGQGSVGGLELAGAADQVLVDIKDSAGNKVFSQELGAMQSGIASFFWDGNLADGTPAPEGVYRFSVEASMGGKPIEASALQAGTISALTMLPNGISLQVGDNKTIGFADIRQILN